MLNLSSCCWWFFDKICRTNWKNNISLRCKKKKFFLDFDFPYNPKKNSKNEDKWQKNEWQKTLQKVWFEIVVWFHYLPHWSTNVIIFVYSFVSLYTRTCGYDCHNLFSPQSVWWKILVHLLAAPNNFPQYNICNELPSISIKIIVFRFFRINKWELR